MDDNSVIFAGNQTPVLFASLGPASSSDILVMTFSPSLTWLQHCCTTHHIISDHIKTKYISLSTLSHDGQDYLHEFQNNLSVPVRVPSQAGSLLLTLV